MIRLPSARRYGPIGVDVGARSVKLVQFSADRSQLIDMSRWDIPAGDAAMTDQQHGELVLEALRRAREGRQFRGREAVLCLSERQLFLQNVRVPKVEGQALERCIQQEAASRVPFPLEETELRYIEAADIRQGGSVMREVILLTCHRPVLNRTVELIVEAGLRPVAVDIEPAALLRGYVTQLRRDEDRTCQLLLVHVGYSNTAVIISHGDDVVFLKYIDVGGKHLDEAVARHLHMELNKASALRRHSGDRRSDQKDPEVSRSIAEATRPVLERLASELSMCIRYYSVTFRGQPLERLILGGGEASEELLHDLHERFEIKAELHDPFRRFPATLPSGRRSQWDVAAGLALREVN